MSFLFAYPFILPWVFGVTFIVSIYVLFFKQVAVYRYALTERLKQLSIGRSFLMRKILLFLRFSSLCSLCLLIARPQLLDNSCTINVNGIDIILALDVSGSMEWFDDLKDRTPRIEAAKREALDFVAKRTNDPIGIVLFAAQAFSKIPLTLDKAMLTSTIQDVAIGDIDHTDTLLFTGLATAINRLRNSTSVSKVIVLLTDGVPSENDTINDDTVIGLAKEFGIKIYTLGIGRADKAYTYDQFGSVVQVPSNVDSVLLQKIAQSTGGQYYRVHTPRDLKKAYDSIDQLEKVEIRTTLFHHYFELFSWFIWIVAFCFIAELLLRMLFLKGLI